jgi:uncharacterized protein YndB with AHSA1/START domain
MEAIQITVSALVNAPIETVWQKWTTPQDIIQWNNASDDWHTTKAENDLRIGGRFLSRMEAKDGSMGFDFNGIYDNVLENQLIEYKIEGGRKVSVEFSVEDNKTKVAETFEAEDINSIELQQMGWQAILDNFKRYVER